MEFLFYLFKSSLLMGLFALAYKLLLAQDTFYTYNRIFLLSGLVFSLLFPLCIFTSTVYVEPVTTFVLTNTAAVINTVPAMEETAVFNWQNALVWAYIFGAVLSLIFFARQLFQVYSFFKKRSFYVKNGLKYIETSEDLAPFSFLNYIVFNPEKHDPEELSFILKHEETHARQAHTYDLLATKTCCALLWFNPLAWWYSRLVSQNLELIADDSASAFGTTKNYQLALVKQATGKAVPGLAQSFYQSFLKKRVLMLSKPASCGQNRLKVLAILPFLALFLWSFNIKKERVNYNTAEKTSVYRDSIFTKKKVKFNANDSIPAKKGSKSAQSPTVSTSSSKKTVTQQDKVFRFELSPNTTEAEFEALAAQLERDFRMQLYYSNLNYNGDGIITSINLKMKDLRSRSTSKLNLENSDGLGAIVLFKNEDGAFGFRSNQSSTTTKSSTSHSYTSTTQDSTKITGSGMQRIKQAEAYAKQMHEYHDSIAARDRTLAYQKTIEQRQKALEMREKQLEERRKQLDARSKQIEERNERWEQIMKKQKNPSKLEYIDTSKSSVTIYRGQSKKIDLEDNILYMVDDEVMDNETFKLNDIDSETIKSIHIYKEKEHLKQFGDKAEGKDGVIVITTKDEKDL